MRCFQFNQIFSLLLYLTQKNFFVCTRAYVTIMRNFKGTTNYFCWFSVSNNISINVQPCYLGVFLKFQKWPLGWHFHGMLLCQIPVSLVNMRFWDKICRKTWMKKKQTKLKKYMLKSQSAYNNEPLYWN